MEASFFCLFVYILFQFSTENGVDGKSFRITDGENTPGKVSGHNWDTLLFHPKCGKNAVVLEEGRTLRKRTNGASLYLAGFTNRPLRDNEIFQVRVNAVNRQSVSIGVMNDTPENVTILPKMSLSHNTWMFYANGIYTNGRFKAWSDGIPLGDLLVDETVGVMRDESGNLHLIIDGTDIGVAASNIPPNVYGIFESYLVGQKATIDYSYLPHP